MALSRERERAAAAAVLAAAVGVALWVLHDRPQAELSHPALLKPIAQTKTPEPKPDKPAPKPPMAIELIDIALLEPPAPLPAPRQEAPAPAAAPAPQPEKSVTAPPPAKIPEAEAKPAPPPTKVLKPEPEPPPPAPQPPMPQVTPLRAEAAPSPPFTALKPDDEKVTPKAAPMRDTKALLAMAAKEEKAERAKPLALKPLKPGDEKVTVKPALLPPLPEPEPVKAAPPRAGNARDSYEGGLPPPRDSKTLLAAAARVENTAPARTAPAVVTSEAVGEGRALLRILEQGSGPSIEIGWPDDARARNRLYGALKRCLGMRTGILDNDGRLYMAEGVRNQPTELNTDRYSGFVRRPEGAIASEEEGEIAHVRSYHSQHTAAPARIFPRRVDAYLIGGLRQAVGGGYLSLKTIRAHYRLDGERVVVDGIVADGREIGGAIDFSAVASCG